MHADLIDAVNKTHPTPETASSELLLLATYVGDARRRTDAITNLTEDRTTVAILKQFQPAVLQRPTITNSAMAIERTSVESDFRHIVLKDAERL